MSVNRGEYRRLLESLTNSEAKQKGNFVATADLACRLLSEHLNVERVSVLSWSKDQNIQFEVARVGSQPDVCRPQHLVDVGNYVAELHQHLHIDAADAVVDFRLSELRDHYLLPNNIGSLLDIAIRINGHIEGVVCLERLGDVAAWGEADISFASHVADQLALTLATSNAYYQDEMLSLFQSAIEKSRQITLLVNLNKQTVEYVNGAHEIITGIPRDRIEGRSLAELAYFKQHPEDAQQVLAELLQGNVVRQIFSLTNSRDEKIWVKFFASHFVSPMGKQYALVSAEDYTETKQNQQELEFYAWHCSLTGLYNRTYFKRQLDRMTDGKLVLLNLVGFKRYNDTYGHERGDQLLVEIARRLKHFTDARFKPPCMAARIGSDEFALLLDSDSGQDLDIHINKLYQQLSHPVAFGSESVDVRPAIAIVDIGAVTAIASPLTCADIALQHAKKKQGMPIRSFTSDLLEAFKDDSEIERDLIHAIRKKQFELYYQPLKDLQTQRYIGAEALIRWHHPKRGVLYPGTFIEIAEQKGLINAIGSWVLEAACKQLYLWQHHDISLTMHVNVSARQFFGGNLYEQVWDLLTRYPIKHRTLILEITETELMEDIRYATNLCQELAELGVGLAIDDFGTGYSSMRYLKQFPISKLKIDRSFISDLTISHQSREIVSAIIAMAKALNISLTAEGVEDQEQEMFLTENLCHQAQGFLYSPALREADFSHFIDLQSSSSIVH
ncbi:EAL domain-containing protein [Shewanella avicenniae]|uniref:EAL domain-containing protein n=1 Tax=Shewanella avicenniae TaxID=2814294 RepID=A0ABX7QVA0_9GAMM|nr:EAL domain-containing protein [Shewanella avicenniae]